LAAVALHQDLAGLHDVFGFAAIKADGFDVVFKSSPRASIFCGVLATGNSLGVALLTLTSVAWTDKSTAPSNSKALVYSS
jgi:hypothetical protein